MRTIITTVWSFIATTLRSRASLQAEILALRQQLAAYHRVGHHPRIANADRIFWAWLSKVWSGWKDVLIFVQPGTVIKWQKKRFRDYWSKLSQSGQRGRPAVSKEIRELIQQMWTANPLWGSPRIVGELKKLGIEVAKSTVEKYKPRMRQPPSQNWKTFLKNHAKDIVAADFFVVPTVKFKVLFVFVILTHLRRKLVHFNVTEHPTSLWAAQQIVEAFPWEEAPRYLLRDRDKVFENEFKARVHNMGIEEVLTAPRSPWQNPYAERLIGSIRRDCLDNVIVLSEWHLRRILTIYVSYYSKWRTHLSLEMDCPEPREVQHPNRGDVVAFPEVGGLHHHYERLAA